MDTPSHKLLVYFTTCNIGHQVEVHLKNGSVYSGIFHAADVEKDFGNLFVPLRCNIIQEEVTFFFYHLQTL